MGPSSWKCSNGPCDGDTTFRDRHGTVRCEVCGVPVQGGPEPRVDHVKALGPAICPACNGPNTWETPCAATLDDPRGGPFMHPWRPADA